MSMVLIGIAVVLGLIGLLVGSNAVVVISALTVLAVAATERLKNADRLAALDAQIKRQNDELNGRVRAIVARRGRDLW